VKSSDRVAVASRSFSINPILRAELSARYGAVTFNSEGRKLAGAELVSFLAGHQKAIVALEHVTRDVLARLPDLRVIAKYGVGLDNLDLRAMADRGVRLGWTPGVNKRSVAELAIAYSILLLRDLPGLMSEVRSGTWRQRPGRELRSAIVGVVGCGHVGKEVVRLLRPFGCRILAHDVKPQPEFYADLGVESVSLDVLLARADVVTLHLSLNPTSRGLFNEERIAAMRREAVMVNLSRGGIVDERALKRALVRGAIAGAAFDVFAVEPPDDAELLALPNFFVSPHIGGSSQDAILEMGRAAIAGLDGHHELYEYLRQGYLEFSSLSDPRDDRIETNVA